MKKRELTAEEKSLEAWAKSHDVSSRAVFIPRSVSRNAAEKYPTLNYRVSVKRGETGRAYVFDYSLGSGHVAWHGKPYNSNCVAYVDAIEAVCETGFGVQPGTGRIVAEHPGVSLARALSALAMDGHSAAGSFEEWAREYGFDVDSISALETYKACQKVARWLADTFDTEELAELEALASEM